MLEIKGFKKIEILIQLIHVYIKGFKS